MFCPCEKKNKDCCTVPKITSEQIFKQVEPVLREMEETGVMVNVPRIKQLKTQVSRKIAKLKKDILADLQTEINLDSPSQLSDLLFNQLKLPTEDIRRTQSGFSTAAGELYKIKHAHPAIPKILKYREFTKLVSTYLDPLPKLVDENNRLHTHYSQDARTGRMTSAEPNMQNIPIRGTYGEDIRKTIIAPPGYKLIAADYSQIELRIIACFSGDRQMMDAFVKGVDVHTRTASLLFHKTEDKISKEERRFAKTINFGVLYGMSPFGLSQALNIPQELAAKFIFEYFHNHQGVKEYIEEITYRARKTGAVETIFGFKRQLPNIKSETRALREADERMAVNTPIQGSAAEILKLSMIELHRKLNEQDPNNKSQTNSKSQISNSKQDGKKARLILTVHDELVVECPEKEAQEIAKLMVEVMENVVKLCVPIKVGVGIGNNWDECKLNEA
jgi:DNA polymerase-1